MKRKWIKGEEQENFVRWRNEQEMEMQQEELGLAKILIRKINNKRII
jgi:hypothetical protein